MNDFTERDAALKAIIARLNKGEERAYFVELVGYFIEGIPYSANGLTVDSNATPDIHLTEEGFACTAFFPPHILQPSTVHKNGIIKKELVGRVVETVKVQLEVRAEDIWAIFENVGGTQVNFYSDPETFISRNTQFLAEIQDWFNQRRS